MSKIIKIATGEVQNSPYETQEDLIAYSLDLNWRFATDDEVSAYEANKAQAQNNADILSRITELEQKSGRGLRDAILRNDTTYLDGYDQKISELRSSLKG